MRKNKREKIDYYLAGISHAIACSMGGSKSKLEDHLITFTNEQSYNPDASKNAWFTALGISPQ